MYLTIGFSLLQISTAHRNLLEKMMIEIGLHHSQISVLNLLWESDGQSQAELVRQLKIAAPTVNKMIGSLSANGFVQTKKCKNDSRMVRVYLTKKGKEIRSQVLEQWKKVEEMLLRDFSETEKMLFSLQLEKLKKNLIS